MKFALVNGFKIEAFPKGEGKCLYCNDEMTAKCGPKIIHHWAHKSLKHCDNWWEPETEWHRFWKGKFPTEWQEIIHFDTNTGEKHIADVKTAKGVVIEFQNSPMSLMEMQAREDFYQNMVWVVNGEHFKENFIILDELPDPEAKAFKDILIWQVSSKDKGRLYSKRSEYLGDGMVRVYNLDDLKQDILNNYIGHHQFEWKRPRSTWFNAQKPVFLDFNGKYLYKLLSYYPDGKMRCVKKIDKQLFIERANN